MFTASAQPLSEECVEIARRPAIIRNAQDVASIVNDGAVAGSFLKQGSLTTILASMTYASLGYPTSLRGIGVGPNQTLVCSASTVSLFLFPVLAAALGTKVFRVIALAPLISILVLLAIRWEPSGYDIEKEDLLAHAE